MKIGPVSKIIGVVVLMSSAVVAIRYLETIPSNEFISFLGFSASNESPSPKPSATSRPAVSSKDIPAISLGTVAVQTFSGSSLVRSGSGAVISSDGLIVTVASVVPVGSGSYVYQVAISGGGLLRARAVYRSAGLVILRVEASDLNAVLFDDVEVAAGQQATVAGAIFSLSYYNSIILPANIAYTAQPNDLAISLDRTYLGLLAGARIVDESGRSIGLVQLGAHARLIPSSVINSVIEGFLSQKK